MERKDLGTWDIKHIQDKPFMAFGSMLNSYAVINQGKGINSDDFLKVADVFFKKAIDYAKDSLIGNGDNGKELDFK